MIHPAILYTLGTVTAETQAKCAEVLDALHAATGKTLKTVWGKGAGTEHGSGNALDFMLYIGPGGSIDPAAGDWITRYVIDNADRLGLIHVLWRQRIYRGPASTSTNPKGRWMAMADRGNPTQNHMDHPHVWFTGSPYQPPASTKGNPFMALTDAEQRAMYERIMRGSDRTNPDGSASRLLDSADGDYLRQKIEALTPPTAPPGEAP